MRKAAASACGVLLLLGVAAAVAWLGSARDPVPASITPPGATSDPPPVPDAHPLPDAFPLHGRAPNVRLPPPPAIPPFVVSEVRSALEGSYYRPVPGSVLEEPTVERMLAALADPQTEYLSPLRYQELRDGLARAYFGVGLTVGPGDGGLIVTSSLDGPAREAGIRPGDLIIKIDGRPAAKLPFERSATLIMGEKGTVVELTVHRSGERRPMRFTVVRQEVAFPAVRHRMVKQDGRRVGYVRVLSFREDVASRVAASVERLGTRGAEALILDLRGDPGGLLSQAVEVASVFLAEGKVVSTVSAHGLRTYHVSGAPVDTELPLAVLVDGATASAAEIVAAALVDNERAILVGRRTYGKATVQTLIDLSNGGALKLTTATYVTPDGDRIGNRGIRPSVKAEDDPSTRRDEAVIDAALALLERL